eukprot:2721313-Heterocapsa_arctica.AAC.1
MGRWLEQTYPQSIGRDQERKRDAEGRHSWRKGLPAESSGKWEVKRGDLAWALQAKQELGPGSGWDTAQGMEGAGKVRSGHPVGGHG